MIGLRQPLQAFAREAGHAARAALWRAGLIVAALLFAAIGTGFLIFAGYEGLRLALGPGLAAFCIAAALLAVCAGLLWVARNASAMPTAQIPADHVPRRPQNAPPDRADPATMAVFTAAFLVGRSLADRLEQSRNPDNPK